MKIDVELLRSVYPEGTKIRLLEMKGEPQMKRGMMGTVRFVDDMGQVHVRWDNGSGLALDLEADEFEIARE